jgi:hypothetical protein
MRDLRNKTSPACCERRQIARRRTEEERAEALFPLRVTATAPDSKRDCVSSKSSDKNVVKNTSEHGGLKSQSGRPEF